jgi:hypothetical protein
VAGGRLFPLFVYIRIVVARDRLFQRLNLSIILTLQWEADKVLEDSTAIFAVRDSEMAEDNWYTTTHTEVPYDSAFHPVVSVPLAVRGE